MSKFYGKVGYVVSVENPAHPGVFVDKKKELRYSGDLLRISRRWIPSPNSTNDDLNINHKISIIADPYAYNHFHEIKWVEWNGVKWKVPSVEVQFPRLILDVGGVYTEEEE